MTFSVSNYKKVTNSIIKTTQLSQKPTSKSIGGSNSVSSKYKKE